MFKKLEKAFFGSIGSSFEMLRWKLFPRKMKLGKGGVDKKGR